MIGRLFGRRQAERSGPRDSARPAGAAGQDAIPRQAMTDWAWRPDAWCRRADPAGRETIGSGTDVSRGVTVFHDGRDSGIALRQMPNAGAGDRAPYRLDLDVLRFGGSYLSLVIGLPAAEAQALRARHILRLDARIERATPVRVYARLNIRHGPNTERIVRELPDDGGDVHAEFELAHSRINERRLERAWMDLIFDRPEMTRITLWDLTLSRHPRADL